MDRLGQHAGEREGDRRCTVMREIARKHDISVATVALGYVLAKPFVMSVIIGASRMDQLEQNLAATGLKLDGDDLARLDEVSALPAAPASSPDIRQA
ncbi:hypothetical protein EN853_33610, partial [Mesorhizobium sp. M1C.F.Ca.ET.210.01.1.1]|uniref:aldo/keto reductase n=1 Tax=Mesorhizobium sp. M1C.F.Ca.ET.210.01.1.1 TaxID=2563930 RepID=UPI0011369735